MVTKAFTIEVPSDEQFIDTSKGKPFSLLSLEITQDSFPLEGAFALESTGRFHSWLIILSRHYNNN